MITTVYKGKKPYPGGKFATIIGKKIKYEASSISQAMYAQIKGNKIYSLTDGVLGSLLATQEGNTVYTPDGLGVIIKDQNIYYGLEVHSDALVATVEGENMLGAAGATLLLLKLDFKMSADEIHKFSN